MSAAPADVPALPDPPHAPRTRRRGAPWIVVALSLAFAMICLAVAGAVLVSQRGSDADAAAVQLRASAVEAARERTIAVTSYDHRRLDEDVAGVLATATGDFEQEYTATVESLRETFVSGQVVATATVVAAGLEGEVVETEAGERAVVVVAVDQVITAAGAEPRTEPNRLRMTLVRPEETWLVEGVERL